MLYNLYYMYINQYHLAHLNKLHDYYIYYMAHNFHYLENIHLYIDYKLNLPMNYDTNIDLVQYNLHEHYMLDHKRVLYFQNQWEKKKKNKIIEKSILRSQFTPV